MKTTKAELMDELTQLRQRVSELEASETECKGVEEVLRESEQRYRELAENINDVVYVIDENGLISYASPSAKLLTGYAPSELIGQPFSKLVHPEDRQKARDDYKRIVSGHIDITEYRVFTKSGEVRWIRTSSKPVLKGNHVIGMRGVMMDITERKQAEEALRNSERKFRSIFEQSSDGIALVDEQGTIVDWNEGQERITGVGRGEVTGRPVWDVMFDLIPEEHRAPAMREQLKAGALELLRSGRSPVMGQLQEVTIQRRDGTLRVLEEMGFPIGTEQGFMLGVVCRDITERKQAEEALRQSEERYRTILEEMEEGYYELDLNGDLTSCNDSYRQALGYSPEEITGMNYAALVAEADRDRMLEMFLDIYRKGKLIGSFTCQALRKDGSTVTVESAASSLRDKEGQIIGFRGIGRDITERKQMEEALRQSEERYRLLAENAKDAIWTVDMNMRPTFMGPSITSLLGYSVEEAMVKSMEEVYTPASLEIAMKLLAEELAIENMEHKDLSRSRVLELELIHKDGSIVPIEGKFSFIREPDAQPVEILAIARDITERKQMEEERKELEQKAQMESRLASLGLLASGVGHEINNPLTGVIGYAQLLLGRDIPEDIRKDVESINKEAQRVASIVKRLVAFARYQKPQRTYASISDIVAGTVDLLAHQLETSSIQTNLHLDPNLPWTIADIGQLQQVFLNIIINAETEVRSAHGKGKLSIKTEKTDNTIRVSFKDDGPGIAEENLKKIFDPFFTTRQVGEGTGLGLSICHEIIAEHGGRLYAKSKPGKGATFIVELPVLAEEKHPQAAKPVAEEAARAAGARILVVDDERLILHFVSQVLTDEGHEVETVDNAQDALGKIESERYSLILLDIKMPGMSGIELYNHLQKTAQSLARRVVFITGDVMGAETTAFLSRIKAPRIDKPFDAEQLKSEINRMLAQGRS